MHWLPKLTRFSTGPYRLIPLALAILIELWTHNSRWLHFLELLLVLRLHNAIPGLMSHLRTSSIMVLSSLYPLRVLSRNSTYLLIWSCKWETTDKGPEWRQLGLPCLFVASCCIVERVSSLEFLPSSKPLDFLQMVTSCYVRWGLFSFPIGDLVRF